MKKTSIIEGMSKKECLAFAESIKATVRYEESSHGVPRSIRIEVESGEYWSGDFDKHTRRIEYGSSHYKPRGVKSVVTA